MVNGRGVDPYSRWHWAGEEKERIRGSKEDQVQGRRVGVVPTYESKLAGLVDKRPGQLNPRVVLLSYMTITYQGYHTFDLS